MAETFGRTEKGADPTWYYTADRLVACKFQSGSAGSLASISAYLKYYEATAPVKCAIYDSSRDLVANGTTEELSCESGQDNWMTFNFGATKPSVSATSDYWLCLWCDEVVASYYIAGAVGQANSKIIAYGNWPGSLPAIEDMTVQDRECSIYATYEEAPPPAAKTLVQAALISIPPLIVLPTLGQILRFAGGY